MNNLQLRSLYVAIILGGLTLLVAGLALVFFSPSGEVVAGSEDWCDAMVLLPHSEWLETDFELFAKECLDPEPTVY